MLCRLVALTMYIPKDFSQTDFEAKFKLSQNKTLDNQQGVIDGLTQLQSASADNMATLINNLFEE